MENMAQVHIEFLESKKQQDVSAIVLAATLSEALVELGVEPTVVGASVKDIALRRESSLSVDPGSAAIIVATIGVAMGMIRAAVDLYMHRQDLKLAREELELKQQQSRDDAEHEREYMQEVLETILKARLADRFGIEDFEIRLDSESPEHR